MQTATKGNEDRFRIIFEQAPDAMYLTDKDGRFVDGNRAAEELTGYGSNELVGKTLADSGLLSARQRPVAARILALNTLGSSSGPNEFELRRKDGSPISVEVRTKPIDIGGAFFVLGIARDTSHRFDCGHPNASQTWQSTSVGAGEQDD